MFNRTHLRLALVTLFILCGSLPVILASFQEQESDPKTGWPKEAKKVFVESRKARRPTPKPIVGNAQPAVTGSEFIGVTIWRLRPATEKDPPSAPRRTGKDGVEYVEETAAADTVFREGEFLRLSVEYPPLGRYYLYWIDCEEYRDGSFSPPKLIYPGKSMPPDGNVLTPGRPVYLPAAEDPFPYFRLKRKPDRQDQVSERLTLLISREPLLPDAVPFVGPRSQDSAQITKWEKEWGVDRQPERYESYAGAGRIRTEAETKDLDPAAPFAQTFYRVAVKPNGKVALVVRLKIAPPTQQQ